MLKDLGEKLGLPFPSPSASLGCLMSHVSSCILLLVSVSVSVSVFSLLNSSTLLSEQGMWFDGFALVLDLIPPDREWPQY